MYDNTVDGMCGTVYTPDTYLCYTDGAAVDGVSKYSFDKLIVEHALSCNNVLDFAYESAHRLCDKLIFHRHTDHLGSASYVTSYDGTPVQFFTYRPYGEVNDMRQADNYDERCKFTGKERDEETGYDYFGARYYGSVFPLWLSVAPIIISRWYTHKFPII